MKVLFENKREKWGVKMKLKDYIKDKAWTICIVLLGDMINVMMLRAYGIPIESIIASGLLVALSFFIVLVYDYVRKYNFYKDYVSKVDLLDKKYLIGNMVEKPDFIEGKIVCDSIYDISKNMTEHVNEYKFKVNDFKEYIEIWIHEVKLPIAAMSLRIHNKMGMDPMLLSQLKRIEDYVEQVLFLVRSENADRDYMIRKVNLAKVSKGIIMKNKDMLLESKIQPGIANLDFDVYTDKKKS